MTGKERAANYLGRGWHWGNPCKTFRRKNITRQRAICEAAAIAGSLGVPLDRYSARRIEQVAMSLAGIAGVRPGDSWGGAQDVTTYAIGQQGNVDWWNEQFGEAYSRKSYDSAFRQGLLPLVELSIAVTNKPDAAGADGTKKWGLNPELVSLLKTYGTPTWKVKLEAASEVHERARQWNQARAPAPITVEVGEAAKVALSRTNHNSLQKRVVEVFLNQFAPGSRLLYLGDDGKKDLWRATGDLEKLGMAHVGSTWIPDVLAFDDARQWLFIVEAFQSRGPITRRRMQQVERTAAAHEFSPIFVTAFPSRVEFRAAIADIPWETEVWIADAPGHLVHFNGDKFLGPYPPATL